MVDRTAEDIAQDKRIAALEKRVDDLEALTHTIECIGEQTRDRVLEMQEKAAMKLPPIRHETFFEKLMKMGMR